MRHNLRNKIWSMMKWNDQAVLEMHLYFRQQGQSVTKQWSTVYLCLIQFTLSLHCSAELLNAEECLLADGFYIEFLLSTIHHRWYRLSPFASNSVHRHWGAMLTDKNTKLCAAALQIDIRMLILSDLVSDPSLRSVQVFMLNWWVSLSY